MCPQHEDVPVLDGEPEEEHGGEEGDDDEDDDTVLDNQHPLSHTGHPKTIEILLNFCVG